MLSWGFPATFAVPVMRIRVLGGLVAYIGNLSFMETTSGNLRLFLVQRFRA